MPFSIFLKYYSSSLFSSVLKYFHILLIGVILVFIIIEWLGKEGQYAIEKIDLLPRLYKILIYSLV